MLVAKKQEYFDVYEPQREEEQERLQRPKVVPQARPKLRTKIIPIAMIMVGFAMASLIVMRFAIISENNQYVLQLERELEKQHKTQENLKLELNYQADLYNIEEKAKDDLGMSYPAMDQVRFVEVPDQKVNSGETQIAQQSEPSILEKILRFID